jgi:tripartite-type tricarboxylate transporter receptor subunit TctC
VRLIVPFAPAGATDITARLMGQWLSERLGQQFIIDNRPGAGGNIGTEAVVRAPVDGYTLLLVGGFNAINAALYEKLNFNFIHDISPVASIIRMPNVMVVNPSVPVRTVPEFIAYAKANPGKVNMASGGIGTPQHLAGELFKMMTGVNMVHVPYRGGAPALNDAIGGHVPLAVLSVLQVMPQVEAKQLKPLAVTSKGRTDVWPNVPSIAEAGIPGYEAELWFGVIAPAGTPEPIVKRLNEALVKAMATPEARKQFEDIGVEPVVSNPKDLALELQQQAGFWGPLIERVGVTLD